MSKEILNRMEVAVARGHIPEGSAVSATFAVLAERGVRSAMEGYYGKARVSDAFAAARQEQAAMDVAEELISDLRPLVRAQEALIIPGMTHTTSDFPAAMANLRIRAIKDEYSGVDSNWRTFADVTTVPDFKTIRTIRFNELPGLLPRAEGEDVKYITMTEAEEGYRVGNFERALKYTWEMWKNDEWGRWAAALASMGRAARRTETLAVFGAIDRDLPRTTLTAGPGIPTVARLREMYEKMAARKFSDQEEDVELGYSMSDLIYGTGDEIAMNQTLKQQYLDFQAGTVNPIAGMFTQHMERMWQNRMGRDYVGYDSTVNWLEVAFLEGFQNGPKTYVRLPTSQDYPEEGNFEDHTLHVKMGHALGAKVVEPLAVIRVQGA